MAQYCGDSAVLCDLGVGSFDAWIANMRLDPDKPYDPYIQYGEKMKAALGGFREALMVESAPALEAKLARALIAASEKYGWAGDVIARLKDEEGRRVYKVRACFATKSMNGNIYTPRELDQATRTLVNKVPTLNHVPGALLRGIETRAGSFEDSASELVISVDEKAVFTPVGTLNDEKWLGQVFNICDALDHSPSVPEELHFYHVSVEWTPTTNPIDTGDGRVAVNLVFDTYAFLTRNVLPGIPLTDIVAVEGNPPTAESADPAPPAPTPNAGAAPPPANSPPGDAPQEPTMADIKAMLGDILGQLSALKAGLEKIRGERDELRAKADAMGRRAAIPHTPTEAIRLVEELTRRGMSGREAWRKVFLESLNIQ
jgi:hypothetical protein